VSELIRSAVDFWLARRGDVPAEQAAEVPPVYGCGGILTGPSGLREAAYFDREGR
jgi:hypothetical protein